MMRQAAWTAVGVVLVGFVLVACSLDITSRNDNRNDVGCGTCGKATPTPTAKVSSLACERIERVNGEASSCRLVWSGDRGPFDAEAVRSEDGVSTIFPLVIPGTILDPGESGAGGGTWTITLSEDGATLASTVVRLDS